MTMTEQQQKQPIYYGVYDIYTFDSIPEGVEDVPNIFGGHAHSGQKREAALTSFARGDTSVIVFYAREYDTPVQITDPALISWPSQYRPEEES